MNDDVAGVIADLSRGAWTLTALALALERGLLDDLPAPLAGVVARSGCSPEVCAGVLDVLAAAGLVTRLGAQFTAAPGLDNPGARAAVLADLRATLGQHASLTAAAREPHAAIEGWQATLPEVVASQGEVSRLTTERIITHFLPRIPGLTDRLAREGAAVLDVGAGAAGLGVAFCQAWPQLRVVGLEPSGVARAAAADVIRAAGLTARLEMRSTPGQELTDESMYDLAYVAQMFIPEHAVAAVYRAVLRALRPGGWLITAAVSQRGDDASSATSRLRNALWGGGVRFPEDVVAQLSAAGFADVRVAPAPLGSTLAPVLARRP